ncbi:hypothetical protein D3C76_1561940 [compost metagenome]
MQAEQAAQGPEHVHRPLAIAQGGEGQPGAAQQGQQHQQQAGPLRPLAPVLLCLQLAIALGEPEGAGLDALRQVAARGIGAAIGFGVFQGAGVFLAQADGFGQPEPIEPGEGSRDGVGIAHEGPLGRG